MYNSEKTILDSSGRFKTDKIFKDIIIKNSSRLLQRSNGDISSDKENKLHYKINSIKRLTTFKKLGSLKETKLIDSKDNIFIDPKFNSEKKTKNTFGSNLNRVFSLNFNFGNELKKEDKNKNNIKNNVIIKINNSFFGTNIIKINKRNIATKNNRTKVKERNSDEKEEDGKNNKSKILKINIDKNNTITNEGRKELIVNKNNSIDNNKVVIRRKNNIRKIMNSFYYQSLTANKEENNTLMNIKSNAINSNRINRVNTNIKNNNEIFCYNHKKESKTQNLNFNDTKNEKKLFEKKDVKNNSYFSNFYRKKNKKNDSINYSNNLFSSKKRIEDISKVINDRNSDLSKKNNDNSQNSNIIKKLNGKSKITNNKVNPYKNINNSNTINQTMNRWENRKKLIRKKILEHKDNETQIKFSRDKKGIIKVLTPIMKFNKEKKFLFSTKDIGIKNNNFDTITHDVNDGDKSNLILHFFDDLIELCNNIKEKNIFDKFAKDYNKKYIIEYNKHFEKNKIEKKINFVYCFKYFCITLTSFLFLSEDEMMYKSNSDKVHLLFIQFIYSSLFYVGYQDLNSSNITCFFKDYQLKKKISIIQCTTSIIKLLFDDKEEYTSLNNALKQLIVNVRTTGVSNIIKIINETILFCFNQKANKKKYFPFTQINNIYSNCINNNKKEENNKAIEKAPVVPYIKTTMNKKFCLVLDLDETISHSLKLNFGYYFLLRPGVIEFLTELSKFYEIIIFTSSPKIYADSIINKIDEKGTLISHRLYKSHVIFERGKCVKKLSLIGRDLNKIIFVDNLKSNAKYNPKNLYLIPSWTDDIYDNELYKLKNKLIYICTSGKYNDDITKGL